MYNEEAKRYLYQSKIIDKNKIHVTGCARAGKYIDLNKIKYKKIEKSYFFLFKTQLVYPLN